MDNSESINDPPSNGGLAGEFQSLSSYDERLNYSHETPYENDHGYSVEPTHDTNGTTSSHLARPLESNEPAYFDSGSANNSQLSLPILEESTYSSEEISDAPSTPASTTDDLVSTPPRIHSPTANEPAQYAAVGPNASPTLLSTNYPNTILQPTARRTYTQTSTSTSWRVLELCLDIRLYSNNTRLEAFERMIETAVQKRFAGRIEASQSLRLDYGRGPEEMLDQSDTVEGIKRDIEILQREMGISHLVTSSTFSCDSVIVRRSNNTNNESS